MKIKALLASIVITLAWGVVGATLTVDLDVRNGIYRDGEKVDCRRVVFLVLDRSGSMEDKTLPDGRTPNDELVKRLKMRLQAIPSGSEVHVIPFSTEILDEITYKRLDDAARNKIIESVGEKPNGLTVLFDAQEKALLAAAKIMEEDDAAEVSVFVYSDGEHLTPWNYEGKYKACAHISVGSRGPWRRKLVDNHNYGKDLAAARKKFKEQFADFITKRNIDIEQEWVSASDTPADFVKISNIPTSFTTDRSELKNPNLDGAQKLPCAWRIPVSDDKWAEIEKQGKRVKLEFEINGHRKYQLVDLKKGRQTVSLTWPELPDESSAKATLSITGLPDDGKKFNLKAPDPLTFTIPARGKATIGIVSPSEGKIFPAGRKVVFEAKANAPVSWEIAGEKFTGNKVEKGFSKPGEVVFTAKAGSNELRESVANGRMEVIETGVKIKPVATGVVNTLIAIEAEAVGKPLGYSWKVDGEPVAGEGKSLKHKFPRSGRRSVVVSARYRGGLFAEAEAAIDVAPAPFVEIVKPVVYTGEAGEEPYEAGRPFEIQARVEGGLTEVAWDFRLKGATKKTVTTKVVDGKNANDKCELSKGGWYDVAVRATGPGGKKAEAETQVYVKSKTVAIGVVSPGDNQRVKTGEPFACVAKVTGDVRKIQWEILNDSTVKVVTNFVVDVENGTTKSVPVVLPQTLGDALVKVSAEAVVNPDEEDVPAGAAVNVLAVTEGSVELTDGTREKDGDSFKYGTKVVLTARATGAIKEENVVWVKINEDGSETSLAKGLAAQVVEEVKWGRQKHVVEYYAKGRMPNGSYRRTPTVRLEWYCPKILPKIVVVDDKGKFYKDQEGVFRIAAGNTKDFNPLSDSDVKEVSWNFGDGTSAETPKISSSHTYTNLAKEVEVVAWTVCPKCGLKECTAGMRSAVVPPKIRRWDLLVAAILILLLLLYIARRLCFGNAPKHWEFYTWDGAKPKMVNGYYPDELGDAYLGRGIPLTGIRHWNYWTKKGSLSLSELLMLEGNEASPWVPLGAEAFTVSSSNGTPIVKAPEGKFEDISGEVNVTGEAPYFLFNYISPDYSDELKGHDYIRLRVVPDGGTDVRGMLSFLAIFASLLAVFIWFCGTYAYTF